MPKLRSRVTGVVVSTSDENASLLGPDWLLVEAHESDGAPKGNASRDEWAAYATGLGIDVPEDAKRDDIKVLVEAHEATVTPTV